MLVRVDVPQQLNNPEFLVSKIQKLVKGLPCKFTSLFYKFRISLWSPESRGCHQ